MNILILNSSPRKGGNSEVLCEQFQKGAQSAGHSVAKSTFKVRKLHPAWPAVPVSRTMPASRRTIWWRSSKK